MRKSHEKPPKSYVIIKVVRGKNISEALANEAKGDIVEATLINLKTNELTPAIGFTWKHSGEQIEKQDDE